MAVSNMEAPRERATSVAVPPRGGSRERRGLRERLGQQMLHRMLGPMTTDRIALCDSLGSREYGGVEPAGLESVVRIRSPRFYRAVLGGSLGIAESYLRGEWDCDDLTTLFRIFLRNQSAWSKWSRRTGWLTGWWQRAWHAFRDNTRRGSRRNIAAHYDLGNDFYRLWLDETWAYSSAVFPHPSSSLTAGSLEKFDRICRKLELEPTDQLLEIGSGWGGFALRAAEQYGCRVTTTTISPAQREIAAQRFEQSPARSRLTLLDQDYRDLRGSFDKLVSIEMIEAVGHRHLDEYFRQCGQLLRPQGSMVLQAIVIPERRHAQYLRSVDFIQRYVFPGGCLPSLAAICESVGRSSDLRVVHVEDFAPHYAETLRQWRLRFNAQLAEVRRLGYDERLIRIWNYYLSYCEAGFAERSIGVVQVQLDKPLCRRDPARLSGLAAQPAGTARRLALPPLQACATAGHGLEGSLLQGVEP